MPAGYNGKILVVDLTRGTWKVDVPGEAFYRTYLGGSAIGLTYLLDLMPAGADPLGPDNVLTFSASVVTGTPFSGQSRITANARSPLTGAIGDSQAGGFFPAELKAAGYDALVFTGQSSRPVYLWIRNGQVELRDAQHVWGLDTAATEDQLRGELGDGKIQTTAIGPAGENLSRLAAIMNMANRAHGRTGLGAVMGSKRLKAIAVRGSLRQTIADPPRVRELAQWAARALKRNPTMDDLAVNGTAGVVAYQQMTAGLPTRNWQSGVFEEFEAISGDTLTSTVLKQRDTCYACVTRCKRVVEIASGPYTVDARFGGPEYETLATLGSYCGIGDLAAVSKANELCNRYGLDTIGVGATIAWAMECFEHGLLGLEDTGGIDLRFGNADAMLVLVEQMAARTGFGDILSDGSAAAAHAIGRGTDLFLNVVKGAELPAHMPEVKRSLGLVYAVNPFGPDHQSSEHDPSYTPEASALERERLALLGLIEPQDATVLTPEKVQYAWTTQKVFSLADTLCVCQFDWGPAWQLYGPDVFAPMVQAVTGWDVSLDELLTAGERRITMLRLFNAREGFTRQHDTLPAKVLRPRQAGEQPGTSVAAEELERAKDAYYELAGWDAATGNPRPETLARLGLSWAGVGGAAGSPQVFKAPPATGAKTTSASPGES